MMEWNSDGELGGREEGKVHIVPVSSHSNQ